MLDNIRAVFFDLDDTLCAYWEASKKGLHRTFELHGPEGYTPQEMVRQWAAAFREFAPTLKKTGWYEGYLLSGEATRTEQMRLTLLRVGVVDPALTDLLSETYLKERNGALVLFEDALVVLARLKKDHVLGLITNGPADIQRMEIERLQIEPYFDHILIEGEMGVGKPHPSVFEKATSLAGSAGSQSVFVGNSYAHDMAPALAAGWHGIWVRRPTDVPPSAGPGLVAPEELPPGGLAPDAVINELKEILPLLQAAAVG
jgi:putative hydrolase of the HAD superfamily